MSITQQKIFTDNSASVYSDYAEDNSPAASEPVRNRDIFRRISTRDTSRLARQLATLLHAGMPLVPALSAMVEQLQDTPVSEVINDVRNRVNAGSSLSESLARHPDVFPPLFINMVSAGQASGTLEDILLRLAEVLEKRAQLTAKIRAAIAYPLMMLILAAAVVIFLLSYVVPGIAEIFLEMKRELPWPTLLLISASTFIKKYLILIAILIAASCFAARAWLRTKNNRLKWDRYKLKFPLFGSLLVKVETARFARTLGILLTSGIPILKAIQIVKGTLKNTFIADSLDSVKESIGKGNNIAQAVRKTAVFPPVVFHIIAAVQVNGSIEDGLFNIADMYDEDIEITGKTLTSLLEPAILLIVGAIIGFIVLAVLMPIFEINQTL